MAKRGVQRPGGTPTDPSTGNVNGGGGRFSYGGQYFDQQYWIGSQTYYTRDDDPGYGYLIDENDPLNTARRYPIEYIEWKFGGNQTRPVDTTDTTVEKRAREITAAALGGTIAAIYGMARVGGSIIDLGVGGATAYGSPLFVGYGLGHGEIEGIVTEEGSSRKAIYNDDGISIRGDFLHPPWFHYFGYTAIHTGANDQAADSNLAAAAGKAVGDYYRYPGLAYVTMKYLFHETFNANFEHPKFVVKGRKVYDPRLDPTYATGVTLNSTTVVWSDNPALCLADYIADPYFGLGAGYDGVDWDSVIDSANYCDELVATNSVGKITVTNPGLNYDSAPTVTISGGGGSGAQAEVVMGSENGGTMYVRGVYVTNPGSGYTSNPTVTINSAGTGATVGATATATRGEKRHRFNMAMMREATHRSNIDMIRAHFHGIVLYRNGKYAITVDKPWVGVPALVLDEDNSRPVSVVRRSSATIPNKVTVRYTSPAHDWEETSVSVETSAATTGVEDVREATYNLDGVITAGEAFRLAYYYLNRFLASLEGTIIATTAEALALEPNDVIERTSASDGLSAQLMRVTAISKSDNNEHTLQIQQYSPSFYNDSTVASPVKPQTSLTDPYQETPDSVTGLTAVEESYTSQTGTISSRLKIDWTPIEFPYGVRYRVEYSTNAGATYSLLTETYGDGPVYLAPADDNTTYTIRVRAISDLSDERYADATTSVTTINHNTNLAAPTAPNATKVASSDNNRVIDLTWTPNPSAIAAGVAIDVSVGGGAYKSLAVLGATASSHRVMKMDPFTTYAFRFYTVALNGQRSTVPTTASVTADTSVLSAPTGLTVTKGLDAAKGPYLLVEWTHYTGSAFAEGTLITTQTSGGAQTPQAFVNRSATGRTYIYGIDPFTEYSIRAHTRNMHTRDLSTAALVVVPATSQSLAAPTGVTAVRMFDAENGAFIRVLFTPNPDAFAGDVRVRIAEAGGSARDVGKATPAATSFDIYGIDSFTQYDVTLNTLNALNQSVGAGVTVTVASASSTPGTPSGIQIARRYDTHANTEAIGLAWDVDSAWRHFDGSRVLWRKVPPPLYSGAWDTSGWDTTNASLVNDGNRGVLALRRLAGNTNLCYAAVIGDGLQPATDVREVTVYGTPGKLIHFINFVRLRVRYRDTGAAFVVRGIHDRRSSGFVADDWTEWDEIAPGVYRATFRGNSSFPNFSTHNYVLVDWLAGWTGGQMDVYEIQFSTAENTWNDSGILASPTFEIPNSDPFANYEFTIQVRNAKTGEWSPGLWGSSIGAPATTPAPTGLTVSRVFNAKTGFDDVTVTFTPQTGYRLFGGTRCMYRIGAAGNAKDFGIITGGEFAVKGVDPLETIYVWLYTVNDLTGTVSANASMSVASIVPAIPPPPQPSAPVMQWLNAGKLTANAQMTIATQASGFAPYYGGTEVEVHENHTGYRKLITHTGPETSFAAIAESVNPFAAITFRARTIRNFDGAVSGWSMTNYVGGIADTPPAVTGFSYTRERMKGGQFFKLRPAWTVPAQPYQLTRVTFQKRIAGVAGAFIRLTEITSSPAEIEAVEESAEVDVHIYHINQITGTIGPTLSVTIPAWTATLVPRSIAATQHMNIALTDAESGGIGTIKITPGYAGEFNINTIQNPIGERVQTLFIRNESGQLMNIRHQAIATVPSGYSKITTDVTTAGAASRVPHGGYAQLTYYQSFGWMLTSYTPIPYTPPPVTTDNGRFGMTFYATVVNQPMEWQQTFHEKFPSVPTVTTSIDDAGNHDFMVFSIDTGGFRIYLGAYPNAPSSTWAFGTWIANA